MADISTLNKRCVCVCMLVCVCVHIMWNGMITTELSCVLTYEIPLKTAISTHWSRRLHRNWKYSQIKMFALSWLWRNAAFQNGIVISNALHLWHDKSFCMMLVFIWKWKWKWKLIWFENRRATVRSTHSTAWSGNLV